MGKPRSREGASQWLTARKGPSVWEKASLEELKAKGREALQRVKQAKADAGDCRRQADNFTEISQEHEIRA
jgi:hypothetical protein